LPQAAGQKEARYAHLLFGEVVELMESSVVTAAAPAAVEAVQQRNERIGQLEERVGSLEADLAELQATFAEFRKQFD
jgi:uncharacterized protein YceH (UPF0502 family)